MRPKERLLRKEIPKEAIRRELERWSDRLSGWDQFFTAMVVGGLAVEYLPDAASFLAMFSHAVFVALNSHSEPLREFGGLIVIAGVLGEFCIASRERKVESDLRDESNKEIAELNTETEGLRTRTAEAEARIAAAEKATAEANLARVRLQKRFKVRTLSEGAYKDLQEALRPYSGVRIDVFAFGYSQRAEVMSFAFELTTACKRGGCDCKLWEPEPSIKPPLIITGSVLMMTAQESSPEQNDMFFPLANVLASALARSGIKFTFDVHGFSDADAIAPPPAPTFLPWNPGDVARFRVDILEVNLLDSRFSPS